MSTIKVNTIQNTSGVEQYTAKAWITFGGHNGTSYVTTIYDSGNMSSITDIAFGKYQLNFASNLSASTYAPVIGAIGVEGGNLATFVESTGVQVAPITKTTSAIRVVQTWNNSANEATQSYIAFHL